MSTTLQRPVTAEPTSPEQDGPDEKPRRQPKKKTLAGRIGRSSLMLTRRIHLYSGIFMFPWVLLYGFTGWFFNHPRMFTGDQVTTFSADTFPESTLSDLPTASMTAEQVVEEMNLASFLVSGPEVELTDERSPRFTGFLSYTVNTDEASHRVTINPVTGDGEIRTTEVKDDSEETPLKPNPIAAITRVELPNSVATNVQKDVPDLLSQLGLPSGEAFSGRRSASLVFSAKADGVPCIVTCNLANGSITSVRADDRPTMETKSFMQRLHLARMYSPDFDIRWVWALLVDAMFVSMVFWGVSGLLMWWQIKRTRLIGGGVLLASAVFAAWLAVGMHDQLTLGTGRGGGNRGGGNRGGGHAAEPSLPQQVNVQTIAAVDSSRN